MTTRDYTIEENGTWAVCEPIAAFCRQARARQLSLFPTEVETAGEDIRVVEFFAGVGGFRIGLERASERYKTVWSNQWEPSTKRQDASWVYCHRFGPSGHCNQDISSVPTGAIPGPTCSWEVFPARTTAWPPP